MSKLQFNGAEFEDWKNANKYRLADEFVSTNEKYFQEFCKMCYVMEELRIGVDTQLALFSEDTDSVEQYKIREKIKDVDVLVQGKQSHEIQSLINMLMTRKLIVSRKEEKEVKNLRELCGKLNRGQIKLQKQREELESMSDEKK